MSVNSRLKATNIIGQRKELYRQKIPESSCVSKGMVTEKSYNLSEQWVDLPREKGSGASWASSEEHLPK